MQILQPPNWPRPKGYSNGIAAEGRLVFTAGVVGWNAEEKWDSDDIVDQFRQTLMNTKAILAEAGAVPSHVVRMTWYITAKAEYLAKVREMGATYRDVFGYHFPAMAVVEVKALMEDRAKIEIESIAVIPHEK